MLYLSKKRMIAIALCALILLSMVTGGIAYTLNPSNYAGTIVIDAGHGGKDGGVSGVNTGIKESDLNLAISFMLENKLKSKRFNVVMTRKDSGSLGTKKREDMAARKKIIESAKPDIVISIHMNRYQDSSRRGIQVFYDDTLRGESAAATMQGILNTHLNLPNVGRADYQALAGDFYITKCYPCPSMIIECGFLSSPEDEKLLTNNAYQKQLVDYIAAGIDAIFHIETMGIK